MLRRPSELDQAIKADDIPSGIRLIPRKLEIHPGERWLTPTFLKALAGIWPHGSGTVRVSDTPIDIAEKAKTDAVDAIGKALGGEE